MGEPIRLFYGDLPTEEKRAKLRELADAGDSDARGYLEGLNMASWGGVLEVVDGLPAEVGSLIPGRCSERGLKRINERDHLQPWTTEVARRLAKGQSEVTVRTSVRVVTDDWPRLGDVDLVISSGAHQPAFLELKCGSGPDAFGPCAWDALKLALLMAHGECAAAYLMAATTREMWTKPLRGAELFGDTDWTAEQVRETYADWFRTWEKRDDPPPRRVPAGVRSRFVNAAEFQIASTRWELRVAKVEPIGEDWFGWEPLLART